MKKKLPRTPRAVYSHKEMTNCPRHGNTNNDSEAPAEGVEQYGVGGKGVIAWASSLVSPPAIAVPMIHKNRRCQKRQAFSPGFMRLRPRDGTRIPTRTIVVGRGCEVQGQDLGDGLICTNRVVSHPWKLKTRIGEISLMVINREDILMQVVAAEIQLKHICFGASVPPIGLSDEICTKRRIVFSFPFFFEVLEGFLVNSWPRGKVNCVRTFSFPFSGLLFCTTHICSSIMRCTLPV